MGGLLGGLMDFIFPSRCPGCGGLARGRGGWCAGCLDAWARARRLSPAKGAVDEAWTLGDYHGPVRSLITRLKYGGDMSRLPYIAAFVEASAARLPKGVCEPDFAVPVPLYPAKEKKRGFNQAELVFRDWCASRGIVMRRALTRTRETLPQYGLTREERGKNVGGAFAAVPGEDVAGAAVLLLDDIFTTGATVSACAGALRKAGAARVFALALASDSAN